MRRWPTRSAPRTLPCFPSIALVSAWRRLSGVLPPQGTPANRGVATAGAQIPATPEGTDSTFTDSRQPDSRPLRQRPPMLQKLLPVFGALLFAGPASAVTVNISDFTFGAPASVAMEGTEGSPSYEGTAGEFTGGIVDGLAAT